MAVDGAGLIDTRVSQLSGPGEVQDVHPCLDYGDRGLEEVAQPGAAYRYQQALEQGGEIVVGMNAFQVDETITLEQLRVDPAIEEGQCQRLADLRARRDAEKVAQLQGQLDTAARGSENLLPLLIHCVENDLTLGEICHTLRSAWGEYQPPSWV